MMAAAEMWISGWTKGMLWRYTGQFLMVMWLWSVGEISRMMCSFLTWTMGGSETDEPRTGSSLVGQVQVFGFGHAEYEVALRH